jgi:hypothetical protein
MQDKYNAYTEKYAGHGIEVEDPSALYHIAQLMNFVYNELMKIISITSKTYGLLKVMVDDDDYDRVAALNWSASNDRGKFYFHNRISVKEKITLHRLLMGFPKGKYVDHINGDTLDNRRSNLRVCSNGDNLRNGKLRPNNSSGYTGVAKINNGYVARIRVNYKYISISGLKTLQEAIGARLTLESEYWYAA